MGGLFFPALVFFFLEPAAAFGRLGAARRFTGGGVGGVVAMGRMKGDGYLATSGKQNLSQKTALNRAEPRPKQKIHPEHGKTLPDHNDTVNSKAD
jgi:hypothetical protein